MNEQAHCPKCRSQLPADAPAGLCPKCLVQAGLESEPWPQSQPERTVPSPASARFEPLSVESLAGKFPQLEILELLGKGGMGAVYKARQRGLDRLVAVKVLPPEIGHDPAFAERFTREARALARLSHNHIVSVFDFGQSDGLFYIVMEYVVGVNLRQMIQTGTLTSKEALAIVPQICEALQFAHDEGIVHRDIKPENILIDKRGRVKIADFGLAKLMASGGRESPDGFLTATHQVMGTMRYMAPEQMQGSREVDHRADIYSLGVIFYELLTGELPMGKFAPPSQRVQIDVRLDEIVLRALEQQPEQRYQHASDIKTDVDAISRSPSAARPESAKALGLAHEEPTESDHEATLGAITAAALMFAVLILTAFAMWVTESVWCLIALGVPAFIAPGLENLARRAGTVWIFFAAVGLSLIGSMALIAYGVWLTESPWPLLAIFASCVGMAAGVAAWQGDEKTGANEKTGTGPVSLPRAATEPRLVQAPADCLLLAAGIAFVTACGVAAWLVATASPENNNPTMSLVRGNLTIASGVHAIYAVFIGVAGLMLRQLRVRLFVLLVVVVVGLFLPAVIALNVVMEFRNMPEWPVAIPLWLGVPAALWAVVTLFRDDVRGAFDAAAERRAEKARTDPATLTPSPSYGTGDVAQRLAVARFLVQGPAIGMVAIGVAAWVQSIGIALCLMFLPMASWDGGVLSASPFVAVLGIPYGAVLLSAGWQMNRLQAYTFAVLAGVLASGVPLGVVWILALPVAIWAHIVLWKPEVRDAFALRLRERILALGAGAGRQPTADVQDAKAAARTETGTDSLPRPKLVPVLATFNLAGAIVLMLVCAMESPAEFAKPVPRFWQVWEQVDAVLGFVMAAGMFAASIGLFLWKPWARKLTLGVCIFGLASLVFDAPYLARFAIPDIYTDIEQAVIAEGIERDVRDFVTLATFLVVFGGLLAFGLACLIGQIIYFTRPRVVAAFESQGEKHGKFLEWLFTGTGAVAGVLSVFGPLALLLGIAALFKLGDGETTVEDPAAVPSLGIITSGIGVHFTVPAGQVAIFEIVTRRDNATVAIPNHCGYVMAAGKPLEATFLWSHARRAVEVDGRKSWRIETRYAGGGGGSTEGFLLPEGLDAAVGSKSLGLGTLEPKTEIVSWCGNVDANKLPHTGLIGLRITVVPHAVNKYGSGEGHIDWKTQLPSSTTRRKLPEPAAETDTNPESKWARQLAESYLQAAGSNNADEPRVTSWLSESFRKRFEIPGGIDTWVYYRFKSYVISTQELSPTQDEAILKGTLEATERHKYERLGSAWRDTPADFSGTVRFTLRLVKEKDSGRWRVDLVQFELPSGTTPTRGDREKANVK